MMLDESYKEPHLQTSMPVVISTPLQRLTVQTAASQINEVVVQLGDEHTDQCLTIRAASAAVEHVEVPWPVAIEIEVTERSFTLEMNQV